MKHIRNEKGTALVFLAAALIVLLGFAAMSADVGLVLLNRERITNAADAAVLAGAQFLPDDPAAAANTARDYALNNGMQAGEVNVAVAGDNKSITVSVQRRVYLFFAPVLGLSTKQVAAHATAQVGGASKVRGAVPLGIPEQTFTYNQLYELKYGGGAGEGGNYGALDFGGPSSLYEDRLKEGYQEWLEVGNTLYTLPGVHSGDTERGIEYRGSGHESCTYASHEKDCPRLVMVPVVRAEGDLAGRTPVTIVGFAAFFLDGFTSHGNESWIRGYFVKELTSAAQAIDGPDFGLRAVKLIR
mgnify:CR=1 FL=1